VLLAAFLLLVNENLTIIMLMNKKITVKKFQYNGYFFSLYMGQLSPISLDLLYRISTDLSRGLQQRNCP